MKTRRYTPANIYLSKHLLTDDQQYEQLLGDDAYKALKALDLTYVKIDDNNQVYALSAENMYIHGFYVYYRKS